MPSSSTPAIPPISRVLETALYVEDMERAVRFYRDRLGLAVMRQGERMAALDAGGQSVLLLFPRGGAVDDVDTPGGTIPGHDGAGPAHMAFAVTAADYEAWHGYLRAQGIALRSEVHWPRGGRSLYFDDPDGHVLELATPGLWRNY